MNETRELEVYENIKRLLMEVITDFEQCQPNCAYAAVINIFIIIKNRIDEINGKDKDKPIFLKEEDLDKYLY
ncbi:MAG TPA: hypothetical protein PKN66_10260 [Thermodesulfovibrio thiophilus]|nr:hypothetical protein [Thermodesulfovibrio thiophilus]